MNKLENKVIYQIYPKSFKDTTGNGVGDINGIISKLDYFEELGVDYLWLSPICESPQRDNGYDISDYYKIDSMFGTNEDYDRLIKEAKVRGIKVMMDLVLNHTSSEHIWFKKATENHSKYKDYYIFRDEPTEIGSFFGGLAWTYCEKLKKYYFRLFDTTQPDLNWSNKEVREDIYEMVNYWIEKGVEGFRLDVIDLIGKDPDKFIIGKGEKFYEYLTELNHKTFTDKLLTVGECWGSSIAESNRMCHKKGLTQAFHFSLNSVTDGSDKWFKVPLDLEKVARIFETWQNDYDGIEALVMNNHDMPRMVSVWLDDKKYRVESAKLLITLFGLMRGNLYIYQGEEIGMTNAYMEDIDAYNDVETLNKYKELLELGFDEVKAMEIIKKTSRDNARVPMQWDSSKNAGFTSGTPWLRVNKNYEEINVEKDRASDNSIYEYYKRIINFRKSNYGLFSEKIKFEVDGDVLKYTRGKISFMANFSDREVIVNKGKEPIFTNYTVEEKSILRPYEVYFTC